MAIFTKDHLQCSVVSTKYVPKQFDFLVLSILLSNSSLMTVAGCYLPPSAHACTLPALSSLLAPYINCEFVLLCDLNRDMFKPPDQVLKQCDSLNLSQFITNPTRYDSKHPEKATLLDVILTNNPDRYQFGVFCNDFSDHCFTACVRNGCSVKRPVLICHRRLLKNFNEQAFLHDLASANWYRISLIFSDIANKHDTIKKMRIKSRFPLGNSCRDTPPQKLHLAKGSEHAYSGGLALVQANY